jgi:RHS repeat-associated protein
VAYGQIDSVSNPAGYVYLGYDRDAMPDSIRYPVGGNGLRVKYRHGSTHTPTYMDVLGSATSLSRAFEIDTLGRVGKRRKGSDSRVFQYNKRMQLVRFDDYNLAPGGNCTPHPEFGDQCTHTPTWLAGEGYAWDAVGNPTGGGITVTKNRLLAFDGFAMQYDSAGNMISRTKTGDSRQLYWNALGQLDSVKINGVTHRYGYDGWGRRVRKVASGVETRHFWDGSNLLLEADQWHNVTGIYAHAGSRPIYMRKGASSYYYVQENAGSIIGLVSGSGGASPSHAYAYRPFGAPESVTEPGGGGAFNPLRFAGQYFDSETGLYYMRARYYDPTLRRFISEDPIGLAGGINPYAYAENDPVNLRDPNGLCPQKVKEENGGKCPPYFNVPGIIVAPPPGPWTPRDPGRGGGSGGSGGGGEGGGAAGAHSIRAASNLPYRGNPRTPFLRQMWNDHGECVLAGAEFLARVGVDGALVWMYSSGIATVGRGALLLTESAGLRSKLILAETLKAAGSNGAAEAGAGLMLLGSGSAGVFHAAMSAPSGLSILPTNTLDFIFAGGLDACIP